MSRRHDLLVDRISRVHGGTPQRKGVDLKPGKRAIEIKVTQFDIYNAVGQLKASRKPCKYVVVPSNLRKKALSITKGTGIGVMDGNGKIVKKCRKK
jgi:hypothetical protein